jgi:hypothetical protein
MPVVRCFPLPRLPDRPEPRAWSGRRGQGRSNPRRRRLAPMLRLQRRESSGGYDANQTTADSRHARSREPRVRLLSNRATARPVASGSMPTASELRTRGERCTRGDLPSGDRYEMRVSGTGYQADCNIDLASPPRFPVEQQVECSGDTVSRVWRSWDLLPRMRSRRRHTSDIRRR